MGFTVKVKDSASYTDMTTESSALAYRVVWQLNAPCYCEVLVNDDSGAKTQTYDNTYIGTGAIQIEQPTNTAIFKGGITGTQSDVTRGVLILKGKDWLHQLDGPLVNFDTREDLGNSYREYQAIPYKDTGTRCNAFYENGGSYYMDLPDDTDLGEWGDDDYNNMKLIFPYKYLGTANTDKVYAYNETVDAHASGGGAITTDIPVEGEGDTWARDADYHTMSHTEGAADPAFNVIYDFKTLTKASGLVDSIDVMKIIFTIEGTGANLEGVEMWIYNYTDTAYYKLAEYSVIGAWGFDQTFEYTLEDNGENPEGDHFTIADCINGSGNMKAKIMVDSGGNAGTIGVKVDEIYFELQYTVTTAHTEQHTINDTNHSGVNDRNRLILADDVEDDGIIDYWLFCISDKISAYAADLVTTYDTLYTIDAATDVTASTMYIARHYHRMTPLAILRDLAQADGTDFWLDVDIDLHWNDALATGGASTWADTDVLTWLTPNQNLKDVINEWLGEGFSWSDYKVTGSDTDATSITAYGTRSGMFSNPDIGSDIDCDAECDARVDRTKDLPFFVGCIMNQYNTTNIGEVVNINSSKLGITNTYYVVTRKEYDSQKGTTLFHLTPRQTTGLNVQQHLEELMAGLEGRLGHLESQQERSPRYTDVWS